MNHNSQGSARVQTARPARPDHAGKAPIEMRQTDDNWDDEMSHTTREEVENVVKTFVERSNRQDIEECVALYDPDGDLQDPRFPEPVRSDHGTVRQALEYFFNAFPDAVFTVHDMIVDGDKVAVEWTLSATHRGEYLDVQPSGKQFQVRNVALFKVADGRFVRDFSLFDATGLATLQTLAATPAPTE